MPEVTVPLRPKGLPMASTKSPTCTLEEFPNTTDGKAFPEILADLEKKSSKRNLLKAIALLKILVYLFLQFRTKKEKFYEYPF